MADKEKSAELILRLYELRREEVMRKARTWYFGKIQPFVEQIRAMGNANFASHLEQVVMRLPDAEARLARFREMSKQMTAARAEQAEAEAANA